MDQTIVRKALESNGVTIQQSDENTMLCEEDGLIFCVVLGNDWGRERWMSNVSHIDSILRRLQNSV